MGEGPTDMIFVVGYSRSGTTMLGRMLGLHSKVHTFGELHFFEQLVGIDEFSKNEPWTQEKALAVTEMLLTRSRDGFFAPHVQGKYKSDALKIMQTAKSLAPKEIYLSFLTSEAQRYGGVIACEQTPRYLFVVNEILKTFPNARVINMIRDPRDVVISQKSKWKRRFLGGSGIPMREAIRAWCNFHPWLVSRLWLSSVNYSNSIEDARFMSVKFEDLLSDAKKEMNKICKFLDLEFENDMLYPPQIGSSSGLDSPKKSGVNKDRAGGWRKTGMASSDRLITEWSCKVQMNNLGYGDFLNDGRLSMRAVTLLLMVPIKAALAIPFNIRRFRGIFSSVKRRLSSS